MSLDIAHSALWGEVPQEIATDFNFVVRIHSCLIFFSFKQLCLWTNEIGRQIILIRDGVLAGEGPE
jgi:hypothetical protein